MQPPDFLTPEEEKQLAQMIETNVDWATEQHKIHEEDAYAKQQDFDEDTTSNFE